MSLKPLDVLVVDDSPTVRGRIVDSLERSPGFRVAGEARDGDEAFELCQRLRPDVVTLDMMMQGGNGLDATRRIMALCPTPILIISASQERGELLKTLDALAAGAVDVLEKPRPGDGDADWDESFLRRLRRVARVRVITHIAGLRERAERGARAAEPPLDAPHRGARLIALGTSTGGPRALAQILRRLGKLDCPVLVVLHLGEPFHLALPDWLSGQVPMTVAEARGGEDLGRCGGQVLFAPPDRHLVVRGQRLVLDDGPERHSCRPSVDVLFESLAASAEPERIVAGLLTGMGRDGATGLAALRRAGAVTFVQDRATSTVFGMPAAALDLEAAEHTLPLPAIPGFLKEVCREP